MKTRRNRSLITKRAHRKNDVGRDTPPITHLNPAKLKLDSSYREDISRINRNFLMLAREVSRHNPGMASRALGIPDSIQPILAGLSLETIDLLAHPHVLQISVRFPETYWKKITENYADGKDGKSGEDNQMAFRVLAAAHSLAEGGRP